MIVWKAKLMVYKKVQYITNVLSADITSIVRLDTYDQVWSYDVFLYSPFLLRSYLCVALSQ